MADSLVASVRDGVLDQAESAVTKKTETRGTNELGKDAFLQLLVAQMKNQDPLNPDTNTEYVAQLAQFSTLEQMQNMNTTLSNTSAFNLVGQYVEIIEKDSSGKQTTVEGTVDSVVMQNSTAYVTVNGSLHKASDVREVKGTDYLDKQNAPGVTEASLSYSHTDPQSVKFKIDMGKDTGKASQIAVAIADEVVDSSYLSYDTDTGMLTIAKDAFKELDAGKYKITVAFDDKLSTTVSDKVTLTVTGIKETTAV